jgi:hypothetical protein
MSNLNQIPTEFALNQDNTQPNSGFNDLYLDSSGNIATIGGLNDLLQTVKNSLWLWIAEYEFDTTIGIAYKGASTGNGVFQSQVEAMILLCNDYLTPLQYQTYGISAVTRISYEVDRENRILIITVILALNNGQNITISQTGL